MCKLRTICTRVNVCKAVKRDVHLASISGGTDILGCFALGNPALPVRAGHIQCLGLGMDVCAYRGDDAKADGGDGSDSQDGGADSAASSRVANRGEMGELVCRQGGFASVISVFSSGKRAHCPLVRRSQLIREIDVGSF